MDARPLRLAYGRLLQAMDAVVDADGGTAPPGEWDATQLFAHLVSVDAGVAATACSVVAGRPVGFDNRTSLEPGNLARIAGASGTLRELGRRLRAQSELVCGLADELTPADLVTPVPTVLVDGPVRVVEGPVPLADLLRGLAEDHLPRHTDQLRAFLT